MYNDFNILVTSLGTHFTLKWLKNAFRWYNYFHCILNTFSFSVINLTTMFKWDFIVDMYLHTVQLTSSAPLALQGALQH